MSVNRKNSLLVVLLLFSISIFGQYTMNSPYSRFGLGDLEPGGFAINKSMGGIGIALREPNQINYLNPASYSTQDSMSFIWDIGMKGNMTSYSTSGGSMEQMNYNFDHLALSFPITKWYFASTGLIPYSKTGYSYMERNSFSDGKRYNSYYNGSGNINRFYIGNSASLFDKKLSVGFNLSYLFGYIQNNTLLSMVDTNDVRYGVQTSKVYEAGISGLMLTLGAQGIIPVSKDLNFIVGGVFEPKSSLDGDVEDNLLRNDSTLNYSRDSGDFEIPSRLGLGITMQYKNKLTLGVDYSFQDWSKASFLGKKGKDNNLSSSNKLSVGLQYLHDKESFRNYFAKVRYRAGFYMEDTYLQMGNNSIKDYGFSVGLGLPFRRTNTIFNIGFEMGKRGTTDNNLIEDTYKRVTLSVSLYDFWFYKRKFD